MFSVKIDWKPFGQRKILVNKGPTVIICNSCVFYFEKRFEFEVKIDKWLIFYT